MQRAVIDTNTWISGLLWRGPPHAVVQLVLNGQLRACTSSRLLSEFERVLQYARIAKVLQVRGIGAAELAAQLRLLCDLVESPPLPAAVCRDPDDDEVLACAVAARAHFIVSGDSDLLALGSYGQIPIVSAAQAPAALAG